YRFHRKWTAGAAATAPAGRARCICPGAFARAPIPVVPHSVAPDGFRSSADPCAPVPPAGAAAKWSHRLRWSALPVRPRSGTVPIPRKATTSPDTRWGGGGRCRAFPASSLQPTALPPLLEVEIVLVGFVGGNDHIAPRLPSGVRRLSCG